MSELAIHADPPGEDDDGVWTLRTVGLAAVAMPVPDATFPAHVELMMRVPAELAEAAWPKRWLETIARIALDNSGWLGLGHTFANGEPPQPLAPDTQLCAIMLVSPTCVESTDVLALLPIYREELAIVRASGPAALVARLDDDDLDETVDLVRRNVGLAKIRHAKRR